jgi:hypothetical protein
MGRRRLDIGVYVAALLVWAALELGRRYAFISSNDLTLGVTLLLVGITIFAFVRRKVG